MRQRIAELLARIRSDSFLKGFSLLSGGTAVTQIVSLVLAPVLTRLYSPAEYGMNAVYISFLTICGVVATLRLQVPIAMSHEADERVALSRLSLASSLVVSVLLLAMVAVFGDAIRSLISVDSKLLLWAVPPGTLMLGAYQVLTQNLLSLKRYKVIARVGILSVASQGISQIILSFAGIGHMGLIAGNLIAYVITGGYMLAALRGTSVRRNLPRAYYRSVITKHADFPRYAFPAELASIGSYSIIPIAITALFGSAATGYYSLANRLIGIPLQLFGDTIRQVYLREASLELHETGAVRRSFARTSKMLAAMAVPSAIVLFALAPTVFSIIFDESWIQAGVYVRAMMPLFLARFIVGPLTSTLNIVGRQKDGLRFHLVLFAGIVFVAVAHGLTGGADPVMFLVTLSAVYAGIFAVFYFILHRFIRREDGGAALK